MFLRVVFVQDVVRASCQNQFMTAARTNRGSQFTERFRSCKDSRQHCCDAGPTVLSPVIMPLGTCILTLITSSTQIAQMPASNSAGYASLMNDECTTNATVIKL